MIYLANDRELTNRVFGNSAPIHHVELEVDTYLRDAQGGTGRQPGRQFLLLVSSGPASPPTSALLIRSRPHAAATNAFRKLSPPVANLTAVHSPDGVPASGEQADDITFDWDDYYDTNQAAPGTWAVPRGRTRPRRSTASRSPSRRRSPRPLTTARSTSRRTRPGTGRFPKGRSTGGCRPSTPRATTSTGDRPGMVTKKSGAVVLSSPVDDVAGGGFTPFQWQAKDFAASYSIEVYKNDDMTFSTANRVISGTSKQSAYVWTKYLPASAAAYLWRVRWTDGDAHVGAWSAPGRFFVQRARGPPGLPGHRGLPARGWPLLHVEAGALGSEVLRGGPQGRHHHEHGENHDRRPGGCRQRRPSSTVTTSGT